MDMTALRVLWQKLNAEDPGYLSRWVVRRTDGSEAEADGIAGGLSEFVEGVLITMESLLEREVALFDVIEPALSKAERQIHDPASHHPKAQGAFVVNCYLIDMILNELLILYDSSTQSPYRHLHEALAAIIGSQLAQELNVCVSQVRDDLQRRLQELASPPEPTTSVPGHAPSLGAEAQGLVGHWIYSDFYSSGGFSARFDVHLILGADGYFVRTKQSVAGMMHTDSSGNYLGQSAARSGAQPGERGRWQTSGRGLSLEYDDGSEGYYSVERDGSSMLLNGKLYQRTR